MSVRVSHVLEFVFLMVAIAELLVAGPMLQTLAAAALNGDSAAIYTAAWGHEVVAFPSLRHWFFGEFTPIALGSGAVLSLVLLVVPRSPRVVFATVMCLGGTILLMYDVTVLYRVDTLTWNAAFESVAFNFVGAVFLAGFVVLLMSATSTVEIELNAIPTGRIWISGVVGIVFSSLATMGAYYVCDYFLRPLPVTMDLRLAPGSRGATVFDQEVAEKDSFKVIPPDIKPNNLTWTSLTGNLAAEWSATSDDARFDLSVDLFSGCLNPPSLSDKPSSSSFRLNDVRAISASFKEGARSFAIYGAENEGALNVTRGRGVQFGTNRDEKTEKNEVWEFVEDASLTYTSRDDVAFYLGTFTVDPQDQDIAVAKPVTLHMMVDGKPYDIVLDAPVGLTDTKFSCKAIATSKAFRNGSASLQKASIIAGARIVLKARPTSLLFRTSTSGLRVNGGGGWINLANLDDDELVKSQGGLVGYVEAVGDATLSVNGIAVDDTKPTDEYVALGNFLGSYEKDGKLRFNGKAMALSKNGIRINPTKFEGGLGGPMALVGGLLFGVLPTLSVLFGRILKSNTPFRQYL
ncbi:hypothetical protein GCM10008012_61620 [Rhizobium anhuiense]|nr:hypothetical protein GCM10008012_61620 [Rhizobium anhuiense]